MPSGTLSPPATQLGARIRALREQAGYSQKQLGTKVGTGANRISDWELGIRDPQTTSLVRIAAAFGMTVAQLVEDINEAYQSEALDLLQRIALAHNMTLSELLKGVI